MKILRSATALIPSAKLSCAMQCWIVFGNFHVKTGNKLGTDVRITGKNRAQAGQQEHVIKT